MLKRVLLTTGGTGGHVFPALAVAEELRLRHPGIELLFMGANYGPERRLAERAGIPFVGLDVRGFLGRGVRGLAALGRMVLAVPRAIAAVRSFHPDAAAGFGSYAAFAPLLAARVLGVPAVLHEQNAVAGMSNRMLARLTRSVCVSLPGTTGVEGRRTVLSGNPVRRDIFSLADLPRDFSGKRLLVVGGSLGAHALNEIICRMLPFLKETGIGIRHQTGVKDEASVKEAYAAAGMDSSVVSAFIDDMVGAYASCDLVLCRAGASTVGELAAAGLPSILVPYPHAAHDHQTGNARVLEEAGAALLRPEGSLDAESLFAEILDLLDDRQRLEAMSEAVRRFAAPHAAGMVVDELERLAGNR